LMVLVTDRMKMINIKRRVQLTWISKKETMKQ
jgi:hypothetical protein